MREIGFDGRIARLVRLDLPPRPVTEADRHAFTEFQRERVRGTPDEGLLRRMYTDAEFAPEFPAHFELEGHLWVQDYQPWSAHLERTWYVFDAHGRYLGPVTMPAGFTVHQIAGDRVIGRWTDELDVEFVRVYRIEKR